MEVNTELHYEYRFLHGNLLITIVKKKGIHKRFPVDYKVKKSHI